MSRSLKLGAVVVQETEAAGRVSVAVDGRPLWFESADVALDDGIEATASAVLLATVAARRRLEIAQMVSVRWLTNTARMMEIWREWWNYPVLPPRASVSSTTRPRATGTALCFSGGVDSFHTLLCGPVKPDVLAFVHGYDIALGDKCRMASFEPALRQVAAATGARPVLLRSNLRQLRFASACPWERSHGGALAAVGHLLAGQVGTLLLSSSFPTTYDMKWGSHWRLDPLWSSDRLKVVHWGASHSRVAKVRDIAGHELARRYLRVCWENRSPTGNCSRCDKCLCTMALLDACAARNRFSVFHWPGSLAEHIDRVPWTRFARTYGELLENGANRRLAESIRSLLNRTAGRPARPTRLRRCLEFVGRAATVQSWRRDRAG